MRTLQHLIMREIRAENRELRCDAVEGLLWQSQWKRPVTKLLVWWAALFGLCIVMPAQAQESGRVDSSGSGSAQIQAGSYTTTRLKSVKVFLRRVDGFWSASLSGDTNNLETEEIDISLEGGSPKVLVKSLPGGSRMCLTKMKNRVEFGYLECNSAFYSANIGSAAAATVLRGVLSFGILTAADAASGNTGFTVSLDEKALDAAVAESKAVELARESAPLIEYRETFARANSSRLLRNFIATYEQKFDPEYLVAKAKEKLPVIIEQENIRNKEKIAEETRRLEAEQRAQQKQEAERQAELALLRQFQNKLSRGDRVRMIFGDRYQTQYFGMIIELKPPLAYIQWENVNPSLQWVRVESLLPPR